MEVFFVWIVISVISGFIGWLIGTGKGQGVAGFWWSFFLGVVGWIIVALLAPSQEVQDERTRHQARIFKATMEE